MGGPLTATWDELEQNQDDEDEKYINELRERKKELEKTIDRRKKVNLLFSSILS